MTLIIVKPFGDYEQGAVVENLPDDVTQMLIDGGYAVEAPEGAGDATEEAPADAAADVEKAVNRIASKFESTLVKTTEKALERFAKGVESKRPRIYTETKDPKHGYKSFSEFLRDVAKAAQYDPDAARRLSPFKVKAPTGQSEGTAADGGYSVIPEWADEIFRKEEDRTELIQYVRKYSTSSNELRLPYVNETSRADGSRYGAVVSGYIGEGNSFSAGKVTFGQLSLTLKKLGALVYLTSELLSDNAFSLDSYVQDVIRDEFRFKINDGIINGSGTGQPKGILNQTALVTVSKESGQAAATVLFANVAKMWARLHLPSRANALWLVNQQVEQQLIQMAFTTGGTTSAYGLTFNASDEFPLRLFGRQVLPIENCSALGNAGDIILCDPTQLAVIEKPLDIAVSPHVNFTTDEVVYRFIYRWDCNSPWPSALTPYKGSQTVSPFITLENRGT